MYISNNTEMIVKLLQLPGIGTRIADKIASMMAEVGLYENFDLRNYVDKCIKQGAISLKKELTEDDFKKAFDKASKIIEDSFEKGIRIISKFDDDFPTSLKTLVDASGKDISPIILNCKGNVRVLNEKKSIAVIGTRNPTPEGEGAGTYYSRYFAENGYNIVSGLALGCDSIAHKGALSVNGLTTAVLAHGLHTISPKKNESIAEEILEKGGVLLSEYFIGTPAYTTYFVERDRIQAGLAQATIVIQCGMKSGTMHAARTTMNNNRILACVRYKEDSVRTSENVAGNEYLIRMGAYPLRVASELCSMIESGRILEYKHVLPELKFK